MSRSWSIVDFFVIVLGGLLGAGVFVAISAAFGDSELLFIMGLAGQYFGHLLVIWLLARGRTDSDLGFTIETGDVLYLALGLLLQLVLAVLILPLANLLIPEGDSAQQLGDVIGALETTPARIGAIVIAVVVAPTVEELTFRGVIIKALGKRSNRTLIVVSALVFTLFHVFGLNPSNIVASAIVVLPQLFIIGLVLAWVTLRSGRLGPAIFLHSGFNLLTAIVLLLPPELFDSAG